MTAKSSFVIFHQLLHLNKLNNNVYGLTMQEGEISPDSWERIINMLNFSFKLPDLQKKPKISILKPQKKTYGFNFSSSNLNVNTKVIHCKRVNFPLSKETPKSQL